MTKSTPPPQPPTSKPRVIVDPQTLSQRRTIRPGTQAPITDIRQTKEYKVAARRWLSTIVALPIFLYTSWVLYDRTYGNSKPKRIIRLNTTDPQYQRGHRAAVLQVTDKGNVAPSQLLASVFGFVPAFDLVDGNGAVGK
ncbi:uncharacterized protein CDV56_101265 [Aspergillus thermomutatus]|uniref:Uncharacterized protein n=1 Tax=Aspergillus thermomutatus TaxID=41047 RepID=A0A397FZ97_ASPTH|nr:uncharacterized protein CDV56_101265 [Aspergillus thermomutatus]RHZ43129.1 hypothetical protein CDV56_101265 [Aspergillus thermomutatus]